MMHSFMHGTLMSMMVRQDGGGYFNTMLFLACIYQIYLIMTDRHSIIYKMMPYLSTGSFRMNKVTLEGTIVSHNGPWNSRVSAHLTDEFSAMMDYMKHANKVNVSSFKQILVHDEERRDDTKSIYICDALTPFKLDDDLICLVKVENDSNEESSSDRGVRTTTRTISIELLSRKLTAEKITKKIDDITRTYLDNIRRQKKEKLFIYRLKNDDDRDSVAKVWHEVEFRSTRNFVNMFFKGKEDFLKKVMFFKENEKWYRDNGHPYTLGIGLRGPPGTGKTSIIKALANLLNRHLIEIPLNEITSENAFFDAYFQTKYGRRDRHEIDWREKILLFEDIDAQSDCVKSRSDSGDTNVAMADPSGCAIDITKLQLNKDPKNNGAFTFVNTKSSNEENNVTLSTLLNVLDGVRENDGRVLIITSNHYDKLDPALTRRGRIDIELELHNADIEIVEQIYRHAFDKDMPVCYKAKLQNIDIPTCNVVSHLKYGASEEAFIKGLLRDSQSATTKTC